MVQEVVWATVATRQVTLLHNLRILRHRADAIAKQMVPDELPVRWAVPQVEMEALVVEQGGQDWALQRESSLWEGEFREAGMKRDQTEARLLESRVDLALEVAPPPAHLPRLHKRSQEISLP